MAISQVLAATGVPAVSEAAGAGAALAVDVHDRAFLAHGVFSDANNNPYMEDRHVARVFSHTPSGQRFGVFAVFDGHGGEDAAHILSERFVDVMLESAQFPVAINEALIDTCAQLEREILVKSQERKKYFGSTGVIVVVTEEHIFCCNVGDSRAILSRDGALVPLSHDHSPVHAEEVKRVKAAGGFVDTKGVNGYISLTRSFGDLDLKGHKHITFPKSKFTADLLVAEPELRIVEKKPVDEIVIVASDGLWVRLSNDQALKIASTVLRRTGGDTQEAARRLVRAVQNAGSRDNITVLVVMLSREHVLRDITVHGGSFFRNIFSNGGALSHSVRVSSYGPESRSNTKSSVELELVEVENASGSREFRGALSSPRARKGDPERSASREQPRTKLSIMNRLRHPKIKANSVHGARTKSLLSDDGT